MRVEQKAWQMYEAAMADKKDDAEIEVVALPAHTIRGKPISPLVVKPKVINTREQLLEQQLNQLRRAYSDLWYRVSATEQRITVQEKQAEKKVEDEKLWFDIPAQYVSSQELVPMGQEGNKLPVRYSDKSFPYVSLPLVSMMFYFRKVYRRLSSYVLTTEATVEGTRKAIAEANEERELLTIIKIQRRINKIQRALMAAIRKNFDSMIEEIGDYTNDNVVIAHVLKQHFEDVGYKSVKVTTNQNKIYFMIDIEY